MLLLSVCSIFVKLEGNNGTAKYPQSYLQMTIDRIQNRTVKSPKLLTQTWAFVTPVSVYDAGLDHQCVSNIVSNFSIRPLGVVEEVQSIGLNKQARKGEKTEVVDPSAVGRVGDFSGGDGPCPHFKGLFEESCLR